MEVAIVPSYISILYETTHHCNYHSLHMTQLPGCNNTIQPVVDDITENSQLLCQCYRVNASWPAKTLSENSGNKLQHIFVYQCITFQFKFIRFWIDTWKITSLSTKKTPLMLPSSISDQNPTNKESDSTLSKCFNDVATVKIFLNELFICLI